MKTTNGSDGHCVPRSSGSTDGLPLNITGMQISEKQKNLIAKLRANLGLPAYDERINYMSTIDAHLEINTLLEMKKGKAGP